MAFNKCTGLTSVKLSSSVTDMGIYAFADCTGITSIDIPDTVLSIGKGAFSGCTKLSNVKVSKNLETLEAELFKNCSVLNNIVIPDKVKSIGESAFCNCYLITDIVIPDSVTVIGNKAFQSCKALTSVAMGNGVRNIEKNAFYLCNKLTDVSAKSIGAWLAISFADPSANPTRYSKSLYINDELMTSLVIPQGITTINDYAFYMVSSIETITFPETISNVGSNAFYEVSPDKLYINDLNGWLNIDFANGDANPTADTTAIYFNNEPVKNLIIPEGVEVIKPYSFYRAAVLESISLPSTLKEIGNRAFTSCKGLKSISFPKALEKIDTYAFGYCSLLESIYLPSSVSSIENYAFYYCNALNNVYYVGNSDLWANVTIGFNNSILTTENINYIYTSSLIDNDVAVVKPLYVPNGKNIICVCYKDGSVTDVSICLYKEQETINFTIENEYDSVKIMVWDNVFDIAPLSSPETIAVSKQFVNKV